MLQAELQERNQEINKEQSKDMSGETKTLAGTGTTNETDQTGPQRTSQQVIRASQTSNRVNKNKFLGDEKEMNGHVFRLTTEGGSAMEYHKTIEQLTGYAGKEFKFSMDMQSLIDDLVEPNMTAPVYPDIIKAEDGSDKPPNTGDVRIWEKKYDLFLKREMMFENNKNKLFSIIWGQCTQSMKDEVTGIKGYLSRRQSRDCIWLIKEIKTAVQRFETTGHAHVAMHRAKQRYYNCTQGTNETISDYFNRFNAVVDVVQKHKGRIGDDRFLIEKEFEYSGIEKNTRY